MLKADLVFGDIALVSHRGQTYGAIFLHGSIRESLTIEGTERVDQDMSKRNKGRARAIRGVDSVCIPRHRCGGPFFEGPMH
jgi:hypothetical protein